MSAISAYEVECIAALIKARKKNSRDELRRQVDICTGRLLGTSRLTLLTKRVADELGITPDVEGW